MSFAVGLYHDFAGKGGLTFNTLPATQSSDYVSKLDGIGVAETTRAEEVQVESPEGPHVSADDIQAGSDDINQMISEGSPTR